MPSEPCPDCGFTGPYDGHVCEATAVEQMREAIEAGIVVFIPPWLGDVLLEIAARLEALEERAPSNEALIADARAMSAATRAKVATLAGIEREAPDWQISTLLLVLADALEARTDICSARRVHPLSSDYWIQCRRSEGHEGAHRNYDVRWLDSSPHALPHLPRTRGKVADVDGLTTVGQEDAPSS